VRALVLSLTNVCVFHFILIYTYILYFTSVYIFFYVYIYIRNYICMLICALPYVRRRKVIERLVINSNNLHDIIYFSQVRIYVYGFFSLDIYLYVYNALYLYIDLLP